MSENLVTDNAVEQQAESQSVLDKLAYTKKRYLRPKEFASYILVNFGQKNLSEFVSANRQVFMMQYAGLSGKAYAAITAFATIYDALDDTLSGLIIDRTRTRWGRIRPFFLIPLPLWIIGGIMLFATPDLDDKGLSWFFCAATIVYGLGMSYFGAWGLMIYNLTPNINERNNLIYTTKFFENFGVWLPSLLPFILTFVPKLLPSVSQTGIFKGFAWFMLIFSAFFAVYGFFAMKERIPLQSREEMNKTSVWGSLKNILTNRPLLAIILADFFSNFKAVGGATEKFFWLNNSGSYANGGVAGIFTGIPNFFMIPVGAKLIKKFGARTAAIIAGVFGFAAYMLMFALGFPFGNVVGDSFESHHVLNLACLTLLLTIAGLPNKIITVCNPILTADALDYMEWKHGLRNEALVTTVQGYFTKLAGTVTGALSGLVFEWINYEALVDEAGNAIPNKEPSIMRGIWAVFCILPALARGLYGISFFLYPIHGELQQRMLVELADKRAETLLEN